jgi:hypothetical protein
MTDAERELCAQIMEAEREYILANPPPLPKPIEPQTIHFSELPEDTSGGPLSTEWNFYRREVGRLLADGHEGRWVLIKGEEVVGIWDTEEDVNRVRLERFFTQPVFMKQICTRERVYRCLGLLRRWH